MEIEEPRRVRDRGATAPDSLRDLLLLHSKFLRQSRITLRFFDWVEISPLQVLDQRKLEHFQIACRPDNDRNFRESEFLRGAPTPFARDQFVLAIHAADNQRLNDSVLPN